MAFLDFFKRAEKEIIKNNMEVYNKEIIKNKNIIFLIPKETYQVELLNIVKIAADKFNRIVYLSINKPAEKVIEVLKENNIYTEKFLFVDAVNIQVAATIGYHNIAFINSPENFEKFNQEFNQLVDKEKFECIIFDSVSTMLIYKNQSTIIKFIHDFIKKISIENASVVFTCLLEDINSALVKDITMFVDKVIEIAKDQEAKGKESGKKVMINKLEKELESITKAYESKLISKESYLNTKIRTERRLKNLRK